MLVPLSAQVSATHSTYLRSCVGLWSEASVCVCLCVCGACGAVWVRTQPDIYLVRLGEVS